VYHKGGNPPSPLALMRSRYSAYALGNVDYIITTSHMHHPDSKLPLAQRREQIKSFCNNTVFQKLEILEVKGNTVTFKAHLMQKNKDASFIEKSAFAQMNSRWFYLGVIEYKQVF